MPLLILAFIYFSFCDVQLELGLIDDRFHRHLIVTSVDKPLHPMHPS